MPTLTCHRSARPWLAALLFLVPAARAEASAVLLGDGTTGQTHTDRVLLSMAPGTETLIESVEIENRGQRFAWIRAFPSEPKTVKVLAGNVFEELETFTTVQRPYRESILDSLFGPSIITALTRNVEEIPIEDAPAETTSRAVPVVDNIKFFSRETGTSTNTPLIPEAMSKYLEANRFTLGAGEQRLLTNYFTNGWVVAVSVVDSPPGSSNGRVWLGPTLYEFQSPYPVIPMRPDPGVLPWERELVVYTIAKNVLIPNDTRVFWSTRPWAQFDPTAQAVYFAPYHQLIDDNLRLELEPNLPLKLSNGDHFVAGRYRFELPPVDMRFEAIDESQAPLLPASGERGSLLDILLVMLLGITPVLYSPESWFLLWMASRARERRREDEDAATWGLLLWPSYCVIVAIFWLMTQHEGGRAAALVPLALGVWRFATPAPDKDPTMRRVRFQKRKTNAPPKRKTEAPPKRKTDAPPRKSDAAPPKSEPPTS